MKAFDYPEDQTTLKKIQAAHPLVRTDLSLIYSECVGVLNGGYSRVRFPQILRTPQEQDDLYALGRTVRNPKGFNKLTQPMGNIVTRAKAWESIHNYGLGVDFCLLLDKDKNGTLEEASWDMEVDLDDDKLKDWMEIVYIFKRHGWDWGGDWNGSFKDFPHFDKDYGLGWRGLKELVRKKEVDSNGYVIIPSNYLREKAA